MKSNVTGDSSMGILDDPAISRLYTPIDIAKEEIWKRWNNEDLKKEVEKFLGNDIPEIFQGKPKAVLARSIASPNREAIHFLKMAQKVDLQPVIIEYLSDKFVAENSDKYYLGKLFFYNERGNHGGDRITTVKIINDIDGGDGHPMCDMTTKWGEGFSDFHHKMLNAMGLDELSFVDMSAWLSNHGRTAKDYYTQYLALFLCHGVLLEEFLTYNKKDRGFVEQIFVPAMVKLEIMFGVKSLVAPLFHSDNLTDLGEDGEKWMQYPESLKQFIPEEFIQ